MKKVDSIQSRECEVCGKIDGHFCECGEAISEQECLDNAGYCPSCAWLLDK